MIGSKFSFRDFFITEKKLDSLFEMWFWHWLRYGSLHKLRLHFLAFDYVPTPLVCTFYVKNLAFF